MSIYSLTKVANYPAVGGMPEEKITSEEKSHGFSPTRSGVFTVGQIVPHRSAGRWVNSVVPWHAETKLEKGVVKVRFGGKWRKLSSLRGWKGMKESEVLEKLLKSYDKMFLPENNFILKHSPGLTRIQLLDMIGLNPVPGTPSGREIPDQWMLNDFGHMSIKYYRDLNHNGKRDKSEAFISDFVHSSPLTEMLDNLDEKTRLKVIEKEFLSQKNYTDRQKHLWGVLAFSHGCIHVFPSDVDKMIADGHLAVGNIVQVHEYDVDSSPKQTVTRKRTGQFEVHFFPKNFETVVYQTSKVTVSKPALVTAP
jgi:hypothetical protein